MHDPFLYDHPVGVDSVDSRSAQVACRDAAQRAPRLRHGREAAQRRGLALGRGPDAPDG